MNEIRIFQSSEFGELEVREIDGKTYFPATACARMLGYENARDAILRHCKGVVKHDSPINGIEQTRNYISEGDLYRLIVHSRLPAAEKFERWVFDEVLPSIRQTGGYATDMTRMVQEATKEIITAALPVVIQGAMDAVARMVGEKGYMLPLPTTAKRRIRRTYTLIGSLDAELRQVVEDMIIERRHTYQEICNILQDEYGIRITKSSVQRYAKHLMDEREERGLSPLD